jgi:hypothetical protein
MPVTKRITVKIAAAAIAVTALGLTCTGMLATGHAPAHEAVILADGDAQGNGNIWG